MSIKSFTGIKKVTQVVTLGGPVVLGYEIHFEDAEYFDAEDCLLSYQSLKDAVEQSLPKVQVNITRVLEGRISLLVVAELSDTEREKTAKTARDKIVRGLTAGRSYASLAEICTEFSRTSAPWIGVRENPRPINAQLAICYNEHKLRLPPGAVAVKVDAINAAAKDAFECAAEETHFPEAIVFNAIYEKRQPSEYRVVDAVREIVTMLEACCPENEHYDPKYMQKIVV